MIPTEGKPMSTGHRRRGGGSSGLRGGTKEENAPWDNRRKWDSSERALGAQW